MKLIKITKTLMDSNFREIPNPDVSDKTDLDLA